MDSILLSIKPKYVQKIFDGSKKYEFRTKQPIRKIKKIIIYETSPTKLIVGEAKIITHCKTPETIWKMTKDYAGISEDEFFNYFKKSDVAVAYGLFDIVKYDTPRTLEEFGIKRAPQSFVYLY